MLITTTTTTTTSTTTSPTTTTATMKAANFSTFEAVYIFFFLPRLSFLPETESFRHHYFRLFQGKKFNKKRSSKHCNVKQDLLEIKIESALLA